MYRFFFKQIHGNICLRGLQTSKRSTASKFVLPEKVKYLSFLQGKLEDRKLRDGELSRALRSEIVVISGGP